MKFPKPIVYFGFFLILAAVSAGIYDSYFKTSKKSQVPQSSARAAAAEKIIDGLFDDLKKSLEEESFAVEEADLADFKKVHKSSYVSKYLLIADELERGRHSAEESAKKNEDFSVSSLNQLKKIYKRKYSTQKPAAEE